MFVSILRWKVREESFFKLIFLVEFLNNVDTSNQFALDIELWISWPIGVLFEPFSNFVVLENIEMLVFDTVVLLEDLDDSAGESTLWLIRRSFHKEHDIIGAQKLFDSFVEGQFSWLMTLFKFWGISDLINS